MRLSALGAVAAAAAHTAAAPAAPTSKRGLAEDAKHSTYCADANATGAAGTVPWAYTWGLSPGSPTAGGPPCSPAGLEFVPMVWGAKDVNATPFTDSATRFLLGFNEPNAAHQSGLTPEEAARLWPAVEATAAAHGLQLVSPATSGCDVAWLTQFFAACSGCKARLAAVATHSYACTAAAVKTCIGAMAAFGLPIWLTETNCGNGGRNATAAEHEAYMREVLPILDGDARVARWAWMSGRDDKVPGASIYEGAAPPVTRTKIGDLYFAPTAAAEAAGGDE
jgi:hypothetical protein